MKRAAGHEVWKTKYDKWGSWVNHCRVTTFTTKKKFWASIQSTVKGNQEVGRICDGNG